MDTFVAGGLGGWWVFGERTAVSPSRRARGGGGGGAGSDVAHDRESGLILLCTL